MKECEKCKQTCHHRPECAKWFSRYSISKSGFWARSNLPFCRFSASISLKYDVIDAMPQDNKKLNCNVSEVFCLICLKRCRLSELDKKFRLISNFVTMATQIKIIDTEKLKGLLFKVDMK